MMNTIIACTDFSPISHNAVQYAAALASESKARLVLFHFLDYPVPATDLSGIYPLEVVEEVIDDTEKALREVKEELVGNFDIEVDCLVRTFHLQADLENIFKIENADLVVMGLRAKSSIFNALFGSEVTAAIRRGKLPLFLIPEFAKFRTPKKILFPFDDQEIPDQSVIQPLLDFALNFNSHIEVLTMFDLEKTPSLAPQRVLPAPKHNLDLLLAETQHDFSYRYGIAISKGILAEAEENAVDMVAMVPHHHSFIAYFLGQTKTQRIVESITVPLLVLGAPSMLKVIGHESEENKIIHETVK